jgi:hypothetical protein
MSIQNRYGEKKSNRLLGREEGEPGMAYFAWILWFSMVIRLPDEFL